VGDGGEAKNEINPDWSLTKTKTANLYSQTPEVRVTHEMKMFKQVAPLFGKALNYEIGRKRSKVGVAMREAVNDVTNAAGIAAVFVQYVARFEKKKVPAVQTINGPAGPIDVTQLPPEQLDAMMESGTVPSREVPYATDYRFPARRISPGNLLWAADFAGSDFDDADFIGYEDEMDWASAKLEFKLEDGDKEKVLSEEVSETNDLRTEKATRAKKVHYTDIYYWRYRFDPDEKSFSAIWRLVYVKGVDKPAIHEPWKGQRYDEKTRKYQGCCKFPVRVCTLTYVSDHPVPPSDSEAGRPQVYDMRRSRSQMFLNRERSIPMRWFDVNRIDPMLQEAIMRGQWQAAIPTNGDGGRSMGEIARASYPSEDFAFDNMSKADLQESWQVGPNQMGASGRSDQTAGESEIIQQNFATRIGEERQSFANFFLSVVETIAGLMVLYSDFPNLDQQEKQMLSSNWDMRAVLPDLVLAIRPDSTIVLDSEQRLQRTVRALNLTAKSGYVKVAEPIALIWELSGFDPNEIMTEPTPQEESPNVSFRFSGKDDMMNPAVVAMLLKQITPDQLEGAKQLLLKMQQPPQPPQQPPPGGPPNGAPGAEGAQGPAPALPPAGAGRVPPPSEIGAAHPDWHLLPKVAKRTRETD
jgi:hypothetical protein